MIQNNHSFYLFGGGFLTGLKSRLEELGTVAGELQGVSPFSQFRACGGQLKRWLPELDEALAQSQAEYLVLDLQTARQKLLVIANFSNDTVTEALPEAVTGRKWDRLLGNYDTAPTVETQVWKPWQAEIYELSE